MQTSQYETWNSAAQNTILRQHGYHWQKVAAAYDYDAATYNGWGDDGDTMRYEWILLAPDGNTVTKREAFRWIEAEQARRSEAAEADRVAQATAQAERDAYYAELRIQAAREEAARAAANAAAWKAVYGD